VEIFSLQWQKSQRNSRFKLGSSSGNRSIPSAQLTSHALSSCSTQQSSSPSDPPQHRQGRVLIRCRLPEARSRKLPKCAPLAPMTHPSKNRKRCNPLAPHCFLSTDQPPANSKPHSGSRRGRGRSVRQPPTPHRCHRRAAPAGGGGAGRWRSSVRKRRAARGGGSACCSNGINSKRITRNCE